MNFSDHSKLKKYISLGLSVCLVAAVFTGCKKEDNTPGTSAPTPNLNLNLGSTEPSTAATEPVSTEPTVKITDKTGVVLSNINVRGTPSQDATITATLSAGDRVEVVRRETLGEVTWGYITDPLGWIVMDYVKMDMEQDDPSGGDTSTPAGNGEVTPPTGTNTTTPANTTEIKGTITGNQVNIRSDPSTTTGMIQGVYNKGDSVTILETKNGWGRTNKGWINMDYVNTSGTTNTNTNTTTNTTTNVSGNGSTTVQFRGIVTAQELNIRASASQNSDRVGGYTYGKRVEILEKDGNWGRTSDGWISLSYVYQDGTTGTNTATGTVITDGLRIRSGPGTGYDVVGSVNDGDTVNILEQFTYGNTTWGCIKNGWISMDYVDVDGNDEDDSDWDDTVDSAQSGSITGDGVRIRSGAGTNYGVVGSYEFGDRVTIYETKTNGDTTWGKVDNGWVSMDYVDLD